MSTPQIIVVLILYSIALALAAYFTKPSWRRGAGAGAGGAIAALVLLGAAVLGNGQEWWRVPIPARPEILALFYLAGAVSFMPFLLITWRVARRFGGRGLAICLTIITIIGPPRDYLFAAVYPEWMVFSPGVAPILADAAAYFSMFGLGHLMMRLIAGPARGDSLQ